MKEEQKSNNKITQNKMFTFQTEDSWIQFLPSIAFRYKYPRVIYMSWICWNIIIRLNDKELPQ